MDDKTHDQDLRELLLRRYGNINQLSFKHKLRYYMKQFAWVAVVKGAYLAKRLFDIVVSTALLVILAPIFLIVAIAIWFEDHGPVLFKQTRVGRWG